MGERPRTVVFFTEPGGLRDPDPPQTAGRDITLIALQGSAAEALAMLQQQGVTSAGVAGWSAGGQSALALAALAPQLVDRLAIIATPLPTDPAALGFDPGAIRARTLLLYGAADPQAGSKHARGWKSLLANVRIEMVPGADHDLIVPMWKRVLSHLAPGKGR